MLTLRQRVVAIALLVALAVVGVLEPAATLTALAAAATLVFLLTSAIRLTYLYKGYRTARSPGARHPTPIKPQPLPPYTVMVALYHEAPVVPALLDALAKLEYPRERLEVMLLVEHDDPETRAACEQHLRPGWRVLVVPDGVPRTKPRALNAGLEQARGELITVYDAEDRPDPDQLLKAARAFEALPAAVAGLQARLDFYNSHQNALTKWFTCEYATHFGLYLEGISAFDHPLPLGGTSTHFRIAPVRELGGWDAWNVTEDCELGMRLCAAGFHVRTLDSTTWEEAVPQTRAWIGQRSRWVKGFAQTGLVLLRAPIRTLRAMGWSRYLASLATVAAVPLTLCMQVIFWTLLWVYIALRAFGADTSAIDRVFPEPFLSLGLLSLVVGNFAVLIAFVASVYQRERWDLVRWAAIVPVYWLLMSIGAWKGVLQLISRPHFWDKTTHGLGREEQGAVAADGAAAAVDGTAAALAVEGGVAGHFQGETEQ